MVSAFASSWPSPPELDTPRKKEESLKALKALVRDWDLLEKKTGIRTRRKRGVECWVMCIEDHNVCQNIYIGLSNLNVNDR